MLREKREVVILLFLFYRNTDLEGRGKWNFHQKRYMVISDFFVVIGACFAPIFAGREYFLLFFTIPLAILFMWSWFSTKYIVGEERITIKSGFVKKRIFIRDIKQISNTKNPVAAYALSFDRLEIVYGAHQTEIISPKDKEQFINLVKIKNPHIEIR